MKSVYKVKFKEVVFDEDHNIWKVINKNNVSLEVEQDGTLLIYEEDIPKAINYGNGFESINYVGKIKENTISYIEELSSWHWPSSEVKKSPSFFR